VTVNRVEAGLPGRSASEALAHAAAPEVRGHHEAIRETSRITSDAPEIVHDALGSSYRQLSRDTRALMESRLGHDFSRVRVHTGETAASAAEAIGTNAFTSGNHIVFGPGRFAPDTSEGRRLLAHELTHTVQQGAGGSPATFQRDETTEKDVRSVASPTVRLREEALAAVDSQLAKRVAKRRADIQQMLDELGPSPKSPKTRERAEALRKDLAKSLEQVIEQPDSPYVGKGLRRDIVNSAKVVGTQKLALKGSRKQWQRYDPIFAGSEVAAALGAKSLTAAQLKALIAQESGDLTRSDVKGKIAGIAQMGPDEEKLTGGKAGDRKIPEKAIVLGAKLVGRYADQLDRSLSRPPADADRPKFIMASYNAGPNAIVTAQQEAIKMGRSGTTWESLIGGGDKSPLYRALEATYKAGKASAKYTEVTDYVDKILTRLPPSQ
jgi:hypothetical protein